MIVKTTRRIGLSPTEVEKILMEYLEVTQCFKIPSRGVMRLMSSSGAFSVSWDEDTDESN